MFSRAKQRNADGLSAAVEFESAVGRRVRSNEDSVRRAVGANGYPRLFRQNQVWLRIQCIGLLLNF